MVSTPPQTQRRHWQRITRSPAFDIAQFVLLIAVVVWFFTNGTKNLGYYWQWYRVPRYLYTWTRAALRPAHCSRA